MSMLTIYNLSETIGSQPRHGERYTGFNAIQDQLNTLNVQFERWATHPELASGADQETVIAAYADEIGRLKEQYGFQSIDVIHVTPDHPEKVALRQKFLAEHIHDDFEVRFFIEGRGLFYLHVDDKVYAVLCEQGDLISVPANTTHWFDMGENPHFKTIRLFTTAYGWVATFTGNPIASTFPTLDQTVAGLS
ncbi:MAG: cupin domain-containing protein [Methylovulum sp.]|nr:cupin domain-containing protein [Methylovulum sp.]